MVEILKQGQYAPLPVEKQVAILFAGTQGLLDDLPVDQIRAFEEFLYPWLERKHPQLLGEVRDKRELSDDLRTTLTRIVTEAKAEFVAARGIKAA
jgi:F-type H+-transporting ATPase subunit alpha